MSSFIRYRQTPLLERTLREHISRLKICYRYSIHTQAKAKCSLPQLEFWRNSIKGTLSQCFSCLQHSLSNATAKIRILFRFSKKKLPPQEKKIPRWQSVSQNNIRYDLSQIKVNTILYSVVVRLLFDCCSIVVRLLFGF